MMDAMYMVHLHPRYDIVMKPPVNGDAKGPTNTAMANIAIATPHVWLFQISANTAGTIAIGEAEKKPAKNLVNIKVWTSLLVAAATAKMEYPNMPMQIGHLLPMSSLAGAHTVGPEANPRTYRVTPRTATSVLM